MVMHVSDIAHQSCCLSEELSGSQWSPPFEAHNL
jgi:hypothetical protein